MTLTVVLLSRSPVYKDVHDTQIEQHARNDEDLSKNALKMIGFIADIDSDKGAFAKIRITVVETHD